MDMNAKIADLVAAKARENAISDPAPLYAYVLAPKPASVSYETPYGTFPTFAMAASACARAGLEPLNTVKIICN